MAFDVNDPNVRRWLEQQKALQSVGVEPAPMDSAAADSEPVVEDPEIQDETAEGSAPPLEQKTEQEAMQSAPIAKSPSSDNIKQILFGKNDLSTVDALKEAQRSRDNQRAMGGIAKSAALIGGAISGVENKGLREIGEDVIKQADDRTKDFEAQVNIQKKDPNSSVSQGYKQMLEEQMGIKLGGDVSAADIEPFLTAKMKQQLKSSLFQKGGVDEQGNMLVFDPKLGIMTPAKDEKGNLIKAADQMFQVKDPLTNQVNLLSRRATPGGGINIKGKIGAATEATGQEESNYEIYNTLDDKKRTKVDKTRDDFLKDTKDDRDAVVAAGGIKQMLAAGKEMNGDVLRAIQNQLARANGEKGTMTEGDVQGFGGKADVLSRIGRFLSMNAVGEMTDSDRTFLTKLSDVMERRANDYVNKQSEVYSDNITKVTGLDDRKARTLLGVEKTMTSNRNQPKKQQESKAGKQLVKKGYNSKTDETQLVYSDGTKEIVKGKR